VITRERERQKRGRRGGEERERGGGVEPPTANQRVKSTPQAVDKDMGEEEREGRGGG
jgi:hypothetical protein